MLFLNVDVTNAEKNRTGRWLLKDLKVLKLVWGSYRQLCNNKRCQWTCIHTQHALAPTCVVGKSDSIVWWQHPTKVSVSRCCFMVAQITTITEFIQQDVLNWVVRSGNQALLGCSSTSVYLTFPVMSSCRSWEMLFFPPLGDNSLETGE